MVRGEVAGGASAAGVATPSPSGAATVAPASAPLSAVVAVGAAAAVGGFCSTPSTSEPSSLYSNVLTGSFEYFIFLNSSVGVHVQTYLPFSLISPCFLTSVCFGNARICWVDCAEEEEEEEGWSGRREGGKRHDED